MSDAIPGTMSRRQFARRTAGVAAAAATSAFLPCGVPTIVRAAASDAWGELVGRLEYDGPPPERKKLKVDTDVECCGKFDIRDESLMVGEDRGLGNVYVYVRSRGVQVASELAKSVPKQVALDNKHCTFVPHCAAVWYEVQEYCISNSDPVAHNAAFSPLGDVPANVVVPAGGKAAWKFHRSQTVPVPIKCNYHPWMSAYVLPRDNPYVAISAMDGTFRLTNLPAGELEFQVWQERIGYLDIPQWPKGRFTMTIRPGTNDLGTIKLSPSLFQK